VRSGPHTKSRWREAAASHQTGVCWKQATSSACVGFLLRCYSEPYLDDESGIGRFVTERIQRLPGIRDTFTMIAFKAFT
jgi:hypothetical protein